MRSSQTSRSRSHAAARGAAFPDTVRTLVRPLRFAAIGALTALVVGCGASEPPALEVAEIGFTGSELGALTDTQRDRLATLTAFGAAVARGELDSVAAPFIERSRQSRLLRQLSHEVALRRAGTTDRELRERYRRDPEYELVVRHILYISERGRSDDHRAAARRNAERALERARAGEDFGDLAAELSEEPGAADRGGRLSPGRRGTWVPEFWDAAVQLEEGEVSDVVESQYGFHVITLEEKRTVPFEEVRSRVLPRLVDDPATLHGAEVWADSITAEIEVDTAAIEAWRRERASDSAILARWSDGSYTSGELRRYLATLDVDDRTRVTGASPAAFARVVRGFARNAMLASRANRLDIALPDASVREIERDWLERAEGWASTLGFDSEVGPEAVKAAAMEALGTTRQNAVLARENVLDLDAALRAIYPVTVAEPEPSADMSSG